MKYYYPQAESKSQFLTYGTVSHALRLAGHELTGSADVADAMLVSVCDVTEMRMVASLKKRFPNKTLIAGGHYAFNFWSLGLIADYVWVGEIWDFAEYTTLDDVLSSPYIWHTGKPIDGQAVSTRFDYHKAPMVQIKPTGVYYVGGIGCSNSCAFCFTSATHVHSTNDTVRIAAAQKRAKKEKLYLTVVSNEYTDDPGLHLRDMLARNFLAGDVSGGWVRMGIEFATEERRHRMGKPVSDAELFAILKKSAENKVSLRLFHIGGVDTRAEWDDYFRMWTGFFKHAQSNHLLHFNFTALQYQNYTRLYKYRRDVDPTNYITVDDTRRWYDMMRQYQSHVLVGRPSRFQTAAWRMGVELSRTQEQLNYWLPKYNRRNDISEQDMLAGLHDSGVFDTPRVVFKKKSKSVKVLPNDTPD